MRRKRSVSVMIFNGIRLSIAMRKGRMSCDDARCSSITKIFSFSKISAGVSIIPASTAIISDVTDADTGCTIYVDTNGWNVKPNRVGKDIFSFKLYFHV